MRWQVPSHDVSPEEAMVDFLHANPNKWDGDECGIILHNPEGEELAVPGDYIVRGEDGVYHVEKK